MSTTKSTVDKKITALNNNTVDSITNIIHATIKFFQFISLTQLIEGRDSKVKTNFDLANNSYGTSSKIIEILNGKEKNFIAWLLNKFLAEQENKETTLLDLFKTFNERNLKSKYFYSILNTDNLKTKTFLNENYKINFIEKIEGLILTLKEIATGKSKNFDAEDEKKYNDYLTFVICLTSYFSNYKIISLKSQCTLDQHERNCALFEFDSGFDVNVPEDKQVIDSMYNLFITGLRLAFEAKTTTKGTKGKKKEIPAESDATESEDLNATLESL